MITPRVSDYKAESRRCPGWTHRAWLVGIAQDSSQNGQRAGISRIVRRNPAGLRKSYDSDPPRGLYLAGRDFYPRVYYSSHVHMPLPKLGVSRRRESSLSHGKFLASAVHSLHPSLPKSGLLPSVHSLKTASDAASSPATPPKYVSRKREIPTWKGPSPDLRTLPTS